MPGIAGVINFEDTPNSERVVDAMVASMQNERFYVSGTHATPEMGTYAGWTAHKDSFAASQLILNEQRDIALIIAGECFADFDTRIISEKKGHRIEEKNDWIVHLYEEEGEQFFEKLNGLFSGVLIDKRLEKPFCSMTALASSGSTGMKTTAQFTSLARPRHYYESYLSYANLIK